MDNFLGKLITFAILFVIVFVGFVWTASAQDELLFGQNHFYSVIFRGNGEAIVYAKLAVTNPDDKLLTEFYFEIPNVTPSELAMYQMKLPKNCTRYDNTDPARPCLEYKEADYAQRYYYYGYSNGQAEYEKIQYTNTGNLYRLTLPNQVEPQKSTAIIVAYAAKGYVNKNMGLYKFEFETIKVPSRIQEIRVAVDVDSDLLLKGKRSSVNYGSNTFGLSGATSPTSISGPSLDKVVGSIGSYGAIVKDAKNLAPNESFIVKGEYATSWFKLYFNSIFLTILIIATILAGIYLLNKLLRKRKYKNLPEDENIEQAAPQPRRNSNSFFSIINVSIGFFSVISVIGLTAFLQVILETVFNRLHNVGPIFGVIGFITIILLYILIIFGPAIIVAIKYGWKSFIAILVAEFVWFVFFLIIFMTLFQTGLTPSVFRGGMVY